MPGNSYIPLRSSCRFCFRVALLLCDYREERVPSAVVVASDGVVDAFRAEVLDHVAEIILIFDSEAAAIEFEEPFAGFGELGGGEGGEHLVSLFRVVVVV